MKRGFLGVLFLFSPLLAAAWSTSRLTHNDGSSLNPDLAASGANVAMVWQDDSSGNNDIFFRYSSDGGATWPSAIRLTANAGNSENPAVAVSGALVYVAWEDDTPGNREIYFRTSADSGATWQAGKRITYNPEYSASPAIAADGATVYLVWEEGPATNRDIYFRASVDGGSTWQAAKKIADTPGASLYPVMAVNNAYIYLAWCDSTPGNEEICFRRSANRGSTWQSAQRLTFTSGSSSAPAMAVKNANVYLAWHDDTPGNEEVYFRRSDDRGVTWQTVKRLTNDAGISADAAVAVAGANVYVAWEDDTPGNYELYFRMSADGGATWEGAERLTNNAATSGLPDLGANGTTAFVAYCDDTPGNIEIYFKHAPM